MRDEQFNVLHSLMDQRFHLNGEVVTRIAVMSTEERAALLAELVDTVHEQALAENSRRRRR